MSTDNIDSNSENSDIEPEIGNENIKTIIPFNPRDINIKIIPRNIGQLVEYMEDRIILIPKYQRLPNLWNDTKKSRFIESLMLDLPIPLFYFDEGEDNNWYVVDGLQRMSTLEHFMLGYGNVGQNKIQLRLQDLEFLTEYDGKTWEELPKDIKRRINSNQVTINLIGKGTPDEVKHIIFSRINQEAVSLAAQEIRTALFQGYRVDFLEKLVSAETPTGQLFKKVTNGSVKFKRQEDLDFVSRFIAFYLNDYTTYEPDMDSFITKGTKIIPKEKIKQENIIKDFEKSLELSFSIFGNQSFRKISYKDVKEKSNDLYDFSLYILNRKPINKSIFEVVSIAFSRLHSEQIYFLETRRIKFFKKFIIFMENNLKFSKAITSSTASKESVFNRHNEFNQFLTNFFKND